MPPTILTDDEGDVCVVTRPVRTTRPTAALLHSGEPASLPFQQKAVNDFLIAEAARRAAERRQGIDALLADLTPTTSSSRSASPADASSASGAPAPSTSINKKRAYVEEVSEDDEAADGERENARTNPKRECYCH
jgi:hypothetical protein